MATKSNEQVSWEHPQYSATIRGVKRMRDSVAGEDVIKHGRTAYLPHPCNDPKEREQEEQTNRYDAMICYAEYENVPGNTLDTLVGAMFRVPPQIELDGMDEQIGVDSDGNGMSLSEALELTASECLQMRYHGLLAEYSDLAGQDPTEITVQQRRDMGLRATIKHYPRESIVNWSYKVINGTKQLNMVILLEKETQVFNPQEITAQGTQHERVKAYLMLGLDDDGDYFQRRYVIDGKKQSEGTWSEPIYPLADGSTLGFIPFEIVFSSERKVGDVPKQLGYLDPISLKAVHRYQVSALLKEALRITAQPTSWSKGWTEQSMKLYQQATGREMINLGAGQHIPLFGDAEVGFMEWNADSNGLFKYMEENKSDIIALGGVFNDEGEQAETATAASINSAEKKGVLSTLAKNIEESFTKVLGWVALFDGDTADNITVKLSREFVAIRLTAQDRAAILAEYNGNLITREEALRQLERGGVLASKAADLLDELERAGQI